MSDDTYQVEIVRATLDDYQNRVENEEAGASEFMGNQLSIVDGQICNLATFKKLPASHLPDPPTFVGFEALPAGKKAVWSGVVLLDGKNVAVSMFR